LREVMSVCYDLCSPKPDLLRLLATKLEALVPPTAAAAAAAAKKGAPGRHRSTDSDYSDDSAYSNDSAFDVVAQSAAERSAGTSDSGDSSAADLSSAVDASARLAALLASSEGTAAYLAARHVADVLRDWRPAALTSTELLGVLRALSPRLYSISSSPLETSPPGRTVQITVAVVRYESLGCRRGGVASTCLGERCTPGAKIPVYLYPNPEFRLPADPGTPIVMVGPGTGVAPFRAFLRHRSLLSSSPSAPKPGPAVLFFGSRRRDQDFLYGPELEGAAAAGEVELHTAFSRAGPAKVYVQHQIKENADRVWALLGAPGAQGVLYVCGDGAHMAADVEATIKEIASDSLGGDSSAGEAWFKALAAAGRVRKDTWTA
jgi:sulfite reductase (NADPH) flavoprotein alpha-component